MKIHIDETTRVDSDKYSWMIQRRTWNEESQRYSRWQPVSFHASFEQAITHFTEGQLRACQATNVAEAMASCHALAKKLSAALSVPQKGV